jgi:hypothetical protein
MPTQYGPVGGKGIAATAGRRGRTAESFIVTESVQLRPYAVTMSHRVSMDTFIYIVQFRLAIYLAVIILLPASRL